MEHVWAPWRMGFILNHKPEGCFLCENLQADQDKENYILERDDLTLVIFNIYPYNNGHLLVAPKRHVGILEELTEAEITALGKMQIRWLKILKQALNPHGFNLGMNLGAVAGAGLVDHLHYHIVPRWNGDTNFMPILADTKVLAQSLDACYEKLKLVAETISHG
jgi:ATP adenylyltransferase